MMELSEAVARKVLETVDPGLCSGQGVPVAGKMCVEAAVCFALGLPHGDDPPCVGSAVRAYKIRVNDSAWSSNKARAKGMRRVAIAQLGSNEIDQRAFANFLIVEGVKRILPIALRAAAEFAKEPHKAELLAAAVLCEAAADKPSAGSAADHSNKVARAARNAAYANAYAAAYADANANADANAYADAYAYAYAYAGAATATAAYANANAYAFADAYAYAATATATYANAYAYAYADADADAYAYAGAAAYAGAFAAAAAYAAADAAAAAAARDKVLSLAADIAVEALQAQNCKGCKWLWLCD